MKNSSPSVTYLFFKYFFAVTLLTGSFSLSSIEKSSEVIDISDEIYQGALVIGRVKPGFEVFHAGRDIKLDDSDQIIFGVGRDALETIDLTIRHKSGKKQGQKHNHGGGWRLNRADDFHKLFDEFYDLD